MTRLLSIVSFGFFITNVFCSIKQLNEEFKCNLRNSIFYEFHPVVSSAVEKNELLLPLLNVTDEIDVLFLSNKKIDETIVDKLVKFMHKKVIEIGARKSRTADNLLHIFTGICDFRKSEYTVKKDVLMNAEALETMADVCHEFKDPVQWLVLSSKVLGHPNLFEGAPILLENIRKAFLKKFDPRVDPVNFKAKLKFIKDSFDFYFLQHQPEFLSESAFSIHTELKTEFMRQINAIINDLERISNPFVALSTRLAQKRIKFNFGANLTASNEDLWNFIIKRIQIIREKIEPNCSNLLQFHGKSIIDLIISNIHRKSQNSAPFTLKKAHAIISESFDDYVTLIESAREDESFHVDLLYQEAEHIKMIFEANLKEFNDELKSKISEIKAEYGFTKSNYIKIDLGRIALGSMAFNYLKANHLQSFF